MMEWVNVEDELPDMCEQPSYPLPNHKALGGRDSDAVLTIRYSFLTGKMLPVRLAWFIRWKKDSDEGCFWVNEDFLPIKDPEFWSKLPIPPKENK